MLTIQKHWISLTGSSGIHVSRFCSMFVYYCLPLFWRTKEELEDTNGVIRIRKSRTDNTIVKKKQRSTKLSYKTKDRVAGTALKTGVEFRFSARISSSCSTIDTRRVNLVTHPIISREKVWIYQKGTSELQKNRQLNATNKIQKGRT